MSMTPLQDMLVRHEAKRNSPYLDTVGKLTIGIGHNLNAKPISDAAVYQILLDDIADARRDARTMPWFDALDSVRQDVILDMIFNMGLAGFQTFHKVIEAIQVENWEMAATQMLDSHWSVQVGSRAHELARMMVTGAYQE